MRRLAIVAAVLCTTGVALADEAGNQATATRDAAESLTLLRLPDGAVRVDDNPAGDPSTLEHRGGATSNPNQAGQSEFWRVPGNPWDVFAWLKAHPPAGTRIGSYGYSSDRSGPKTWSVTFARPPVWEVMDARQLVVTVSAAAGGGTALRADGVATWLVPRPATARIPAGAQSLRIAVRGGFSKAPEMHLRESDPRRVALVVRMFNRLPLAQPGVYLCPLDRGIRARLEFRTRDGATLATADTDVGGCETVALTIGASKAQLSGFGLFTDLEAALGRRIDLTPFIGAEFLQEPKPVVRVAHGRLGGVPFEAFAYDGGARAGVCVDVLLAGVSRGVGWCLLHRHGKRTRPFYASTCYPRAMTVVGVLGKHGAGASAKLDDGTTVALTDYELPRPASVTRIGLQGDRVVQLKRPVTVELGYRGPFSFGFARGIHLPQAGFSLFPHC